MDRCVFVNGKRKLLSEKYSRSSKAVNQHLLSASKVTGFRRFISAFEEELDSSIASLYENVLSEIVAFVHSHWQSSDKRRPGLATGVIRCENADGFSLNESLKKLLGKEPICISAPLPPLYTIIDSIRKNEDSKCVIIKQVECLPANFIDDFISIVCDSERDSRLVLLMTISSDASVVYSRCSRQTYSQLLIRLFECPTPATVLNTFMDSVTFNPHCALRVDGKLFDALRENFLSRNYSYELLKKMVRIAAVNHYLSVEHSGSDCWESLVFIERYFAFLKHLHSACDGFPSQHRSIYELHSDLQSKSAFFTDREGLFCEWKSIWLTWSVEEMIGTLLKLMEDVKNFNNDYYIEIEHLQTDLQNLDARKSAMREQLALNETENVVSPATKTKPTSSHFAMQQQMRERMAIAKKLDLLSSDRQRFVKLLTKIFSTALRRFEDVNALNEALIRGDDSSSLLASPSVIGNLEHSLLSINEHSKKINQTSQPDICIAYRTLQTIALSSKNISIADWLKRFEGEISRIEGVSSLTRLYKCIADLEIMGVIKAFSDNCITSVRLLQAPSTVFIHR